MSTLTMMARGLARTRGVTIVMIVALSLGIGTWYAQRQVFAFLATKEPVAAPHVFHVALERGTPAPKDSPPQLVVPILDALLLTPRDAEAVLAAAPARRTATFGAPGLIGDKQMRVRYATPDLFAMFEIPFVAGGPFSGEHEAVVDEAVFGAGAVGTVIRVDGIDVRITGVVARKHRARFHLYERFVPTLDAVYLPLAMAAETRAVPDFTHEVAGGETGYLSTWVELPALAEREVFLRHAMRYPVTLRDASQMRAMFAPGGTMSLWPLLAGLCLVTCVVNLVRMLMVKFGGRSHDLGLMRAFGARRSSVMAQLLGEATTIGVIAGIGGVLFGIALMPLAMSTLDTTAAAKTAGSPNVVELRSVLTTIGASTGAALIAALYPAWMLSRGTPAAQLGRT